MRLFGKPNGWLRPVVFFVLSVSGPAWACQNGSLYLDKPPQVGEGMRRDYRVLCYSRHSTGYSGLTKTGVWSAAYLNRRSVSLSGSQSRIDSFHEETAVPRRQRAVLADYRRSGYDRGHLYPNGDAPDRLSQWESFSLANIIPQDSRHNRGLWSDLEQRTRAFASSENGLYVVTGAAWVRDRVRQIGNGVLVPDLVWKAVYLPGKGRAGAFLSRNSSRAAGRFVSLNELKQETGIDAFPSLPSRIKNDRLVW